MEDIMVWLPFRDENKSINTIFEAIIQFQALYF